MPPADALCSLCNSNSESYDQMHHMEHLIKQYSRSVPYTPGPHRTRPPTSSVLLTGSTGNVGSDFLALLLSDPNVTRIYALNRHSPDGPAPMRVAAQFRTKGLDVSALNSKKLVFIEGDTAKHELGLESNLYSEVSNKMAILIIS
ncbi:hypothetical protein H0H81_012589 [Sphagnurus paluster]|uniref:Thioester reductase (TE) domain-containing protein n=1 Tax=Sphagnurus paluster TaxID=117069 RepID=A0A9P7KI72_9AGAR|nr:hypothetical protein H0H81_012589 [Sphagnurus paluster]